jgi:pimeloyl-ACP methyl ester carboxylesterase
MVAAAIAATGYAVALVDYEGMGDNTDSQPHVVGAILAQQVIDLLKASRDIIAGSNSPCTWNNQLFLMGYSEGGYVTMAVTRELQLRPVAGFTVTASAPLSGPHDLSGTQRNVILTGGTFKAPYFVPMLLTSYNYAYGGQTTDFSPGSPGFAMLTPFDSTLPPLFDGNSQSIAISQAMGMTFNPVSLIDPKIILTQAFIDKLSVDTSAVVATFLKQNDSYRDPQSANATWVPTVPIRMIHHPNDELVPYGNSQVAFNAFKAASAASTVELIAETAIVNIPSGSVKTVHYGSAFPELIDGWNWLDGFKH